MSELPKELFQKWKHSYEEDTKDVTVYRPVSYELGPARGRNGLTFHEDGTFVKTAPGPTDASQKISGKWELEGKSRISVSFAAQDTPSQTIEIVECHDDILKVRKRSSE